MSISSIKTKFNHAVVLTNLSGQTLCQLVSSSSFLDLIRIFALEHFFISINKKLGNNGQILGILP